MAKKHSFAKGVATGVLGTAATVAGAVFAVKKTIIEPEEKKRLSLKKIGKKQLADASLDNKKQPQAVFYLLK